jgi:hypothetical protein
MFGGVVVLGGKTGGNNISKVSGIFSPTPLSAPSFLRLQKKCQ